MVHIVFHSPTHRVSVSLFSNAIAFREAKHKHNKCLLMSYGLALVFRNTAGAIECKNERVLGTRIGCTLDLGCTSICTWNFTDFLIPIISESIFTSFLSLS
jgi:hypothetical protein